MLINENSLNLFDESSQSYLKQQMENYFFSEGGNVDKIEGYTPK
jgi:Fe-S cluster biosynthesis and repair protein YggX